MKRCNRFTRSEGHLLLFLGAVLIFTLSTNPLGAQGSALQFSGAQIVSAPIDSTRLNLNFTIEGWVQWSKPATADTEVILYIGNTGTRGYGLCVDGGTSLIMVLVGGVYIYEYSNDSLRDGELTHISLSYTGEWGLHLNGIQTYIGGAVPNPLLPIDTLMIGACQLNTEGFHGIIDEVRISDTVRYANCCDFTPPTPPFVPDSNTVALYHFDEGSGNTTADAAHGYTGYFGASPHDPTWVESPLPIQLASFTASVANSNSVKLEWTTVSEKNNLGFYVERRKQANGTFTTVSNLIQGAGTSLAVHYYTWTDNTVTAGSYVYRLRQVDLNGLVSYSNEIVVMGVMGVKNGVAPKVFRLLQNYPNPFNPTTTITYDLPLESRIILSAYDALGQQIAVLEQGTKQAGTWTITWNPANFPSGLYFYKLEATSVLDPLKSFVQVRKMLMIK